MKRVVTILLCLAFLFISTGAASPATPTDLYEVFEDDDFGVIENIDRQVFIRWLKKPTYYGEEVTLIAVLVNFLPTDIYTFDWEYSEDALIWCIIQDAHEQTYTFIIDRDNCAYWWRVIVTVEEEEE